MVELKKITILDDNMKECIALDIAPEKKGHVWSNAITLAVAHRRYKNFSTAMECYAIYAEGKMVGLISYQHIVDSPIYKETCYRIRPVMVDKNHQNKGYEEAALGILLEEIRRKPHGEATAIFATYHPKEEDMAKIYEYVGFTKTDMKWENPDDNDIIARIGL
ncbi:MAG: GNAT family N-acetyltransferase [Defluviitaleaceae bacterium]|nr:GNAT family N-acetyltransferase [Defluviitaleaceae bacterium]